jgi:hypothetical protein
MRIRAGVNSRSSCTPIFKVLKLLIIAGQYILSLMTFLAHNLKYFTFNYLIHSLLTRRRLQLHRPVTNLVSYQKGAYCTSIKIFNILPKLIADMWKINNWYNH